MDILEAVLLGALQGVTEFLPVSSSGHLVAAQALLDVESPGVLVEVALHFGTLIAIVVVFWRDLVKLATDGVVGAMLHAMRRDAAEVAERAPLFPTALAIGIGTVPIGLAGVLLGDAVERTFESLTACGAFLCVTGLVLFLSRFAGAARVERVGPGRGFLIGMAQAAALLPGISRSGSTIVAGCFVGLERRTAARFSFLLAVPALVAATGWELRHLVGDAAETFPPVPALAVGTLTSVVVGTVCLLVLLRIVERGRLHWFAAYCVPVGLAMMVAGLSG
jgi:undecaprenyl-diphosphatase